MSDTQPPTGAGRVNRVSFGKNITIRLDQPLARFDNGLAKAYAAHDEGNKSKKLVALVAGVGDFPRWSEEKAYMSLADPSFIRLVGSGIVFWPVDQQQKYVFMYSANLGDCLVQPGGFGKTHWRHPEIVSYFIQPMARMLREMEGRNFCHGAIRPDNIFYAASDKDMPVTLGDCLAVHPMSAQKSVFLSIDKALAAPMGRGEGSVKDDIYAFGVSLAMFLRKTDEFAGMSDEDILRRKIELGSYAAIIGSERFQATFMDLLRGVLHDDANLRWSVDDIFSWLDGTRLTPAPFAKRRKASRPLMFMNKKYYYADLLALDIHKSPNELCDLVVNGQMNEWIEKALGDKVKYEIYSQILDRLGNISENKDVLVTRMMMLFNKALPIYYNHQWFTYDGIGGMMANASYKGESLAFYQDVIMNSFPDFALAEKSIPQNEVLTFVKLYDRCRSFLKQKKKGYGVERCIYILCKNAPCLSPDYRRFFINGQAAALVAFEKKAAAGGQVALFLDQHLIAYFSVRSGGAIEKSMYDLNSSDKNKQIVGNLRFLASLQYKSPDVSADAVAQVFLESVSGISQSFRNKGLRKQVEEALTAAARQGDLVKMSALLDDEGTQEKDQKAFARAMYEYKLLQNEYDEYNRRLANRRTYGVVNGRSAAAVVSWGIATLITMMVVLAFLSGYQIL